VRSLLFVFFSYTSNAALKIDWKLEDDEDVDEDEGAVLGSWDMTGSGEGRGYGRVAVAHVRVHRGSGPGQPTGERVLFWMDRAERCQASNTHPSNPSKSTKPSRYGWRVSISYW
jgi:hypothetical protein